MEFRIRLPRIPAGLGMNLVGLFGLIAVALAVGGLTGNWWWSALVGGGFAVGLSWVAATHAQAEVAEPAEAERPRLAPAPASARSA